MTYRPTLYLLCGGIPGVAHRVREALPEFRVVDEETRYVRRGADLISQSRAVLLYVPAMDFAATVQATHARFLGVPVLAFGHADTSGQNPWVWDTWYAEARTLGELAEMIRSDSRFQGGPVKESLSVEGGLPDDAWSIKDDSGRAYPTWGRFEPLPSNVGVVPNPHGGKL